MSNDRPSIPERLATLESELSAIKENQGEEKQKLDDLEAKIDSIILEMTRYKGMVGGIILLGSCILAFFKTIPFLSGLFK